MLVYNKAMATTVEIIRSGTPQIYANGRTTFQTPCVCNYRISPNIWYVLMPLNNYPLLASVLVYLTTHSYRNIYQLYYSVTTQSTNDNSHISDRNFKKRCFNLTLKHSLTANVLYFGGRVLIILWSECGSE